MNRLRYLMLMAAATMVIGCIGCGNNDQPEATTTAPKGAVAAPVGGGAPAPGGGTGAPANTAPKPSVQ